MVTIRCFIYKVILCISDKLSCYVFFLISNFEGNFFVELCFKFKKDSSAISRIVFFSKVYTISKKNMQTVLKIQYKNLNLHYLFCIFCL